MKYNKDCRWFSGYKPCHFKRPCEGCDNYAPVQKRVCILSLEAMGAVLRSTCLLAPLRREYPNCHVTWITMPESASLLRNNPMIDRLIVLKPPVESVLSVLDFDLLLAVDKSLEAGALAQCIKAKEKRGFGLNSDGVIVPLNSEAEYQYAVGLDDNLKFFINQKTETQQITESMAFTWRRDPYVLELTDEEKGEVAQRRERILGLAPQAKAEGIIGYNTGCSILFPYKKFTVEHSIAVIRKWREVFPRHVVSLLGGAEDTERQLAMKEAFADDPMVFNSPSREGLRSGILWMATSDLVLSGCSLGMHISIALAKPTIAWFGVSCIQEIDLYDRGIKLQAEVACSPCWKKSCNNEPKCYNKVSVDRLIKATQDLLVGSKGRQSPGN